MIDLSLREDLIQYLKAHQLWLDKKSGQHFLINGHILDEIIGAADVRPGDRVVEIGPGVGTLTQRLAEAAVPDGLVLAIERDARLVRLLREFFKDSSTVKVIHEDVLRYDVRDLEQPYAVVANLPYQITGAILRLFLRFDAYAPEKLVLMMQAEVAERLLAKPGVSARGTLTVLRELFGDAELVAMVSPESFFPPPQVNSAVIKIVRHKQPISEIEPEAILAVARAGFSAKRRTLANALSASWRLSKAAIDKRLAMLDINPQARAEELQLAQWIQLAEHIGREG